MKIQKTPFHCLACEHEWIGELLVEAPIKLFTAALRANQCPNCGAGLRKLAFGRKNVPIPSPVQIPGLTDAERRARWLNMHDNGLSSECIADRMCGLPVRGHYPHDGDDFGRCERLLILYPEWRARLHEMAGVNKYWAALVEHWDQIAEDWRKDEEQLQQKGKLNGSGRCYRTIRSILWPIEQESAA